ncbi:MAG TPA: ABC transporter permease [Nitrospiria bacterium]|nr:ABC transporter permease [Nitrospiria bacterium]
MIRFIVSRLIWSIPVLFLVATLTFAIMHAVPGGPFDKEKKLPPEIKANVEAKYHLNEPLWRQYLLYLGGLLRGDLGPSYKYLGRTVNDVIADTFPVSAELGLLAMAVAVVLGVGFGTLAAVKGGTVDRINIFLATAGISVPSFVLGAFLVLVFAHILHLFPPALWEDPRHAVLPAIALGMGPAAYIARLTRSAVLEVAHQDFVRTARAKGLAEAAIIRKYLLRNALTPVVTILGPLTAGLVTGSLVIEYIFSIPGMGRFYITAVTNRDYPLVMGVTLIYAVLIVAANLAVDLINALLDPRIRLE